MTPVRRAVNLATLLTQTARRLPDRDAIVHGHRRWSWGQLDAGASALARELASRGIGTGDRVIVHSPNDVEFVQAMFAVWRVGAVIAPTNCRLLPDDVAVVARVCAPKVLICHASQPDHARAIKAAAGPFCDVLWIAGEGSDAVGVVAPLHLGVEAFPDAPVGTGAHAWYFFTSGTSGAPKAAVLTHDQMGFVVTNHIADLMPGLSSDDVSLVVAPLSHGAGIHLLPQVARGARSVLTTSPGLDGAEVWELVERERVTNIFTVPTILTKIVDNPEVGRRDHSSLRHVVYAGAPMYAADQERARRVLGDVLVQYYGLGEVTGNITVLPPAEHGRGRPEGTDIGTCGRVRTGMQVVVRAPDGVLLGTGEVGEVCVAGPAVCHGYLANDEANAAAFRDGWFHTGDLGMLDAEGYLYITGRASDMYISGGSNVHPRDIEEKLVAHPGVREVAVLGMPHPVWGEVGVAVWIPARDSDPVDAEALTTWLASKVARYKMPGHFVEWSELPKSGYGKIVKRTIREELLATGWSDGEPGRAS